ncbi:MAG: 1-acyl-sn-glycerol-3-phosphate acyltransferase [Marinovum sp.]|nr:1-acyl-sn-glycerol-3-phosphate acyltransferase [Marinovum sp.]
MLQWIRSAIFVFQIYLMMLLIGIFFLPGALVSRTAARYACKTYCRWVFWTMRWMVGIQPILRGTPPQGEVLVAAKHQSFLDIMMIFEASPSAKFIMKRELLWTPVIGLYAQRIGCVAVDRGKKGAAVEKMLRDVEQGSAEPGQLIIYPQGTRVPPGVEAPYKAGIHALYNQMEQPCLPVATNVGLFWPRKGIIRRPGTAIVEFLDPIAPGLERLEFMQALETLVESKSNSLMREGGFDA